jgi:hypothetical protein
MKQLKRETAIGIIIIISIVVGTYIYIQSQQDIPFAKFIFPKKSQKVSSRESDSKILFASMGDRQIYKVKKEDRWVIVENDQESQLYDDVATPVFSQDGTQFAYSAVIEGEAFVVINSNPQTQMYNRILEIVFSPDGKSWAYVAEKNNINLVILNGQESKSYKEIGLLNTPDGSYYVVFSPDGEKIAYKVVESQGVYMVIDGQAGKKYSDIIEFLFSQDGSQFAYTAELGNQQVTVLNNTETLINNTGTLSPTSTQTSGSSTSSSSKTSTGKTSKNTRDIQLDPARLFYPNCEGGAAGQKGCNF